MRKINILVLRLINRLPYLMRKKFSQILQNFFRIQSRVNKNDQTVPGRQCWILNWLLLRALFSNPDTIVQTAQALLQSL